MKLSPFVTNKQFGKADNNMPVRDIFIGFRCVSLDGLDWINQK